MCGFGVRQFLCKFEANSDHLILHLLGVSNFYTCKLSQHCHFVVGFGGGFGVGWAELAADAVVGIGMGGWVWGMLVVSASRAC